MKSEAKTQHSYCDFFFSNVWSKWSLCGHLFNTPAFIYTETNSTAEVWRLTEVKECLRQNYTWLWWSWGFLHCGNTKIVNLKFKIQTINLKWEKQSKRRYTRMFLTKTSNKANWTKRKPDRRDQISCVKLLKLHLVFIGCQLKEKRMGVQAGRGPTYFVLSAEPNFGWTLRSARE